MKKCRFCAELIQDEAIKCRHCGSMLNASDAPARPDVRLPVVIERTISVVPARTEAPKPGRPKQRTGLVTKLVAGLVVLGAIGVIVKDDDPKKKPGSHSTSSGGGASPAAPTPTKVASLPKQGPKLEELMGRTRQVVRRSLGTPNAPIAAPNTPDGEDQFAIGDAQVLVGYDSGKAVSMTVSTDGARYDEAALRAWLTLPSGDKTSVGGRAFIIKRLDGSLDIADAAWEEAAAKKLQVAIATDLAKRKKDARDEFAKRLDTTLLDNGISAKVLVDGTVLRLQWIGCSRAAVYKLFQKEDSVEKTMSDIGFTKVVCFDGYDSIVSLPL